MSDKKKLEISGPLWKDKRVGVRAAILAGIFLLIAGLISGIFLIISKVIEKPPIVQIVLPNTPIISTIIVSPDSLNQENDNPEIDFQLCSAQDYNTCECTTSLGHITSSREAPITDAWYFNNVGDKSLIVETIESSCDNCLFARIETSSGGNSIDPGGKGVFRLEYYQNKDPEIIENHNYVINIRTNDFRCSSLRLVVPVIYNNSPSSTPTPTEKPTNLPTPQKTIPPTPLPSSIDIVLIIDGSVSMNEQDFMNSVVRPFVQGFLIGLQQAKGNEFMSVMNFSNGTELIWPLTNVDSLNVNGILDRVWAGGGDQIHLALNSAHEELITNGRSGSRKMIIILSDGILKSSFRSDSDLAIQSANNIKSDGITICLIAAPIGTVAADDLSLLQLISSGNGSFFEATTSIEINEAMVQILTLSPKP
jgi:hypothetical protein